MATASCRRSISTWSWNACPIPRATGSRSPCRANSCPTNITRPAATCRNMGSRRGEKTRALSSTSLRAKRSNPSGGEGRMDCFVACAPRNDGRDDAALRPRLHLRNGLRHQLVRLRTELRFRQVNALGGEIAHHLADHVAVALLLEVGGDHGPGIVIGGLARQSELLGHP